MNTANYIPVDTKLCSEPALACPMCGSEYVHPVSLECASPGTRHGTVSINANGLAVNPQTGPSGRGTRITLGFLCEQGHVFEYALQFHKGCTLVERSMGPAPSDVMLRPQTIWRD